MTTANQTTTVSPKRQSMLLGAAIGSPLLRPPYSYLILAPAGRAKLREEETLLFVAVDLCSLRKDDTDNRRSKNCLFPASWRLSFVGNRENIKHPSALLRLQTNVGPFPEMLYAYK